MDFLLPYPPMKPSSPVKARIKSRSNKLSLKDKLKTADTLKGSKEDVSPTANSHHPKTALLQCQKARFASLLSSDESDHEDNPLSDSTFFHGSQICPPKAESTRLESGVHPSDEMTDPAIFFSCRSKLSPKLSCSSSSDSSLSELDDQEGACEESIIYVSDNESLILPRSSGNSDVVIPESSENDLTDENSKVHQHNAKNNVKTIILDSSSEDDSFVIRKHFVGKTVLSKLNHQSKNRQNQLRNFVIPTSSSSSDSSENIIDSSLQQTDKYLCTSPFIKPFNNKKLPQYSNQRVILETSEEGSCLEESPEISPRTLAAEKLSETKVHDIQRWIDCNNSSGFQSTDFETDHKKLSAALANSPQNQEDEFSSNDSFDALIRRQQNPFRRETTMPSFIVDSSSRSSSGSSSTAPRPLKKFYDIPKPPKKTCAKLREKNVVDDSPLEKKQVDNTPAPEKEPVDDTPFLGKKLVDDAPSVGVKSVDNTPRPGKKPVDKTPLPGKKLTDNTPRPGKKPVDKTPLPGKKLSDKTPLPGRKLTDETPLPGRKLTDETPLPGKKLTDETPLPGKKLTDETPLPGKKLTDKTPLPGKKLTDKTPRPRKKPVDSTPRPEKKLVEDFTTPKDTQRVISKQSKVEELKKHGTPFSPIRTFLTSLSGPPKDPNLRSHPEASIYYKSYKSKKEELAKRLFKLYNREVFDGRLPDDLLIEWNARMLSTAGFCSCKLIKKPEGSVRTVKIVLSTKILDSADRLRDTLIHELCHAAVWLLNNIAGGHGPFWKAWASKAERRFPELPAIKRCHEYKIETKFTYRCTNCGYSFGRHSKSINLRTQICGYCHGTFEVLVNKQGKKDNGETVATPATPKPPTGFALFVKENYGLMKKEHSEKKHGDIMKLLGQKFAEVKIGQGTK